MTPTTVTTDESMNILLTSKQREICKHWATAGNDVTKKRAIALLAIDDGMTQIQAGRAAGLTRGQVNYAVTLLKTHGTDFFGPVEKAETPQQVPQEPQAEKKKKKKAAKKRSKKEIKNTLITGKNEKNKKKEKKKKKAAKKRSKKEIKNTLITGKNEKNKKKEKKKRKK